MTQKITKPLIIRLSMSKYDICKHLYDQGNLSFFLADGKSNTKRLWREIERHPTLMKKLKWPNKQRFRKVHRSEFSQKETEILIRELKLYELD